MIGGLFILVFFFYSGPKCHGNASIPYSFNPLCAGVALPASSAAARAGLAKWVPVSRQGAAPFLYIQRLPGPEVPPTTTIST